MSWLRDHCPRLAVARDQYVRAVEAERERQRVLCDAELRWRAIVAHRELQLLRAAMTGDRRYVSRRAAKLERAQAKLAEVERARVAAPADDMGASRSSRGRRVEGRSRGGRGREVAV